MDPIVLQIFESAAGLDDIPSPPKIRKHNNDNFKNNSKYMSISDECEWDDRESSTVVEDLIENVFARLTNLGIFFDRENSKEMISGMIVNYLECGYPEETIIDNAISTFIE